jgi:hypothetical protein
MEKKRGKEKKRKEEKKRGKEKRTQLVFFVESQQAIG